jgi:hypothetical protein
MNICSLLEQLRRLYVCVNLVSNRSPIIFLGCFSLPFSHFSSVGPNNRAKSELLVVASISVESIPVAFRKLSRTSSGFLAPPIE